MSACPIPVVETARLRLRGLRCEDFARQAEILGDEEVTRFLGGPLGAEEAWRKLLSSAGLWPVLGYGYWAVERKDDGLMLGIAGFGDFERDMAPSIRGLPEMGWIFAREAQGRGYATEAVAAGLAWIDAALPGVEVPAVIAVGNAASIRVAEKSGFSRHEDARYRGTPILLFRRPPAVIPDVLPLLSGIFLL